MHPARQAVGSGIPPGFSSEAYEIRGVRLDEKHEYFVALPSRAYPYRPAVVSVHGISRNAREHAKLLGKLAHQHQVPILAPLFAERWFPDYQRLGASRADLALDRILADAQHRFGLNLNRPALFGYSGGAQFCHRYALKNPTRFSKLGLGAAGWYTFPDRVRAFPHGIRESAAYPQFGADLAQFLRLPIRIVVGALDTERCFALNRSAKVDLNQGATRIERAIRWAGAIRTAALGMGKVADLRVRVLPHCEHCFEQNAGSVLFQQWFNEEIL